ncbi:unnamed protein product [Effrenium voratum]|uniref:Uncharacterized protein n=1 Tax=Effrenium voratum TaxID=2562239 RepID=A0AA36MXJ2_9DINO|nr:unnamed protein product [Effrenium voratum]CAJ1384195.1 unnamed protein product [Effrenium voratum]CAJ1418138.1 unnamed protein product [Effrenium voratum]|mmetsp:Transcript_82456/g.197840  ORF Transcript_82456/g.197840 Transcript_82456/m.197840 type:complete len:259 (-) Transcript_82456:63-839(-)
MVQSRNCVALAAGSAAVALIGAPAFTSGPNAASNSYAPARSHGTVQQGTSSMGGVSCTVAAAGVIALGAAGRRAQKVARAGVLTKDDQGRFRFDAPETPLVPSEQPGVTMPLGFFDPLGFTKSGLMTFPGDSTGFKHLRAAEIKHGRFAMMAATGSLFAHFVKFPGFEDVPTGLAALGTDKGLEGFSLLLFMISAHEAVTWKPVKEPGSFGDPFQWKQFTPEMRSKEINNGRMAMFAIMGQIAAELETGKGPVDQFLG